MLFTMKNLDRMIFESELALIVALQGDSILKGVGEEDAVSQ